MARRIVDAGYPLTLWARRPESCGSGQLVKLINNLVMTAHLGIAGDPFALADSLGIERSALAAARGHGVAGGEVLLRAVEDRPRLVCTAAFSSTREG
jgi:3-hydroxyisobutyrate dehydrogenase-like beta-hydroxyacid dehydrogenase